MFANTNACERKSRLVVWLSKKERAFVDDDYGDRKWSLERLSREGATEYFDAAAHSELWHLRKILD